MSQQISMERPRSSARALALLLLAMLVPFGFVAILGVRATQNEEAAVERSLTSRSSAAVARVAARVEQALAERTVALQTLTILRDGEAPTLEAIMSAGNQAFAQFGKPWIATAGLRLLEPTPQAQRTEADSELGSLAASELEVCRRRLDDARNGDSNGRQIFVERCEEYRAARRRPWSTLVIAELKRHPDLELAARLLRWYERHRLDMRPVERAANRRELAELPGELSENRSRLIAALGTSADDVVDISGWLRTEEAQTAFARAERESAATFRGKHGVGAIRMVGNLFVGFFVSREELAKYVVQLDPTGQYMISLAHDASQLGRGDASHSLAPGLTLLASSRTPLALDQALSASRTRVQLIVISALAAIALLGIFMYVRMQRATKLADMRTGFVAAVSHELKTPIASLRLLTDLLAQDSTKPSDRAEIMDAVSKEISRLAKTTERFLDYSRFAAGRGRLRLQPSNLAEIAERCVSTFRARHPEQQVDFVAVEAWAMLDSERMEIVIENLLENALRHAPEGAPYCVVVEKDERSVRLSVDDAGPGIPKSVRHKIFDAFERGEDRLSHASGGTGIGLALVRAIVRGHGGQVTADQSSRGGARIDVRLRSVPTQVRGNQ